MLFFSIELVVMLQRSSSKYKGSDTWLQRAKGAVVAHDVVVICHTEVKQIKIDVEQFILIESGMWSVNIVILQHIW